MDVTVDHRSSVQMEYHHEAFDGEGEKSHDVIDALGKWSAAMDEDLDPRAEKEAEEHGCMMGILVAEMRPWQTVVTGDDFNGEVNRCDQYFQNTLHWNLAGHAQTGIGGRASKRRTPVYVTLLPSSCSYITYGIIHMPPECESNEKHT